jgi:hypothetical protein
MGYVRRPFNPLTPTPNQVITELNQANENFDILARAFVSDNPETFKVKQALNSDNAVNSDTVDGFHASLTPQPNTIKPLDHNTLFYHSEGKGSAFFDPSDFTMSNNIPYFIGRVNITTPSWSPSGYWKLIFTIESLFRSSSSGVGNFSHAIFYYDSFERIQRLYGLPWFWNAPANRVIGVADCVLISELRSSYVYTFDFYVIQENATANAVFQAMEVNWYLFPA